MQLTTKIKSIKIKTILQYMPIILILVSTIWNTGYYFKLNGLHLLNNNEDDVSYYFNIARNLSNFGIPFTFDRINYTNGFHPLWMLICSVNVILTTTPEELYVFTFRMQYIIFLICVILIYLITLKISRSTLISMSLAFFFSLEKYYLRSIINGLETPLFLCFNLLALYLLMRIRFEQLSRKVAMILGILMSLLVLSRLDAGGLFASGFLFILCFQLWRLGKRKEIIYCMLSWGIPILFYILASWWYCGSPIPVSGAMKRHVFSSANYPINKWFDFVSIYNWESSISAHLSELFRFGPKVNNYYITNVWLLIASLSISLTISLAYFVLFLRLKSSLVIPFFCSQNSDQNISPRKSNICSFAEVSLTVFCLISTLLPFIYKILYGGGEVVYYYTVTFSIAQLLFVAYILAQITKKFHINHICYLLFALIIFFQYPKYLKVHRENFHWMKTKNSYSLFYNCAKWIKNNTPENAIIAGFNSGILGLFSERRTVNLDGKVNSYDYFKQVIASSNRAAERIKFLKKCGVSYISDRVPLKDVAYLENIFTSVPGVKMELIREIPCDQVYKGMIYKIEYNKDTLQ